MSKIIQYAAFEYRLDPFDHASVRKVIADGWVPYGGALVYGQRIVQPVVKYDTDSLKNAEKRAAQAEDELKDTKEAFGILCAEEKKVKKALETLELATNKWTYDCILATTLLLCILAFTYMIMIYKEYQTELCLY